MVYLVAVGSGGGLAVGLALRLRLGSVVLRRGRLAFAVMFALTLAEIKADFLPHLAVMLALFWVPSLLLLSLLLSSLLRSLPS